MVLTLDQLCTGVWGNVIAINTSEQLQHRLRDFGLVQGTPVCRRYTSPAGDVAAIELRGSILAIRKGDMHRILVRV
jgi:Fe2+ transport system protein FeoA